MSRTRCGILHAAPQSRDRTKLPALHDPGSAAHRFAKSYALRCVRGTRAECIFFEMLVILQNVRDAVISADFIARTGEICMISMYSQIAPRRPMLMLDARLAP